MDYEAELNQVEFEIERIQRAIYRLEDEGMYGNPEYCDLRDDLASLESEAVGLQDEIDRS